MDKSLASPISEDSKEHPTTQWTKLSDPGDDYTTWQLQKAVEFWPPSIEKADFCCRRRKGDVAGTTKEVVLATRCGNRPSRGPREKRAILVLHDWNTHYCFWTLTIRDRRYVVHLDKSQSSIGEHWRRWYGVQESYEDKAIAFPIEGNNEAAASSTSGHNSQPATQMPTPRSEHNAATFLTALESNEASDIEQQSNLLVSFNSTGPASPSLQPEPRRSTQARRRVAHRDIPYGLPRAQNLSAGASREVGQPSLVVRLPLRCRQTGGDADTPAGESEEEEQSSQPTRRRLGRRQTKDPISSTRARVRDLNSLQSSDKGIAAPSPRPTKRARNAPTARKIIVLSDNEDADQGTHRPSATRQKPMVLSDTEDVNEVEV
ncbi:MAG: hypothetical protein Q9225_001074 [Loekoesia sp. 1 TL-2023]